MKRRLLIGLILLIGFMPIFVNAETKIYFSSEEINIAPGKTKTVDVIVDSDEDFTSASFNVITTSSYVNFYSIDISDEFKRVDGKGYILTSEEPKKSGTKIASVTLKASDSASIGTTGFIRLINSTVTTSSKMELAINQVKVTVSNEKSSNNNLASMTSNIAEISFSKDTLEYNVTVPNDTSEFDLTATAEDTLATVNISDQQLKTNKTNITVTVTAENGSTKEYKVIVNKQKKKTTTKAKVNKENNSNKTEDTKNNDSYKPKWIVVLVGLLVVFILDILYMKKKK